MPLIKLATAVDRVAADAKQRAERGGESIVGLPTGFYRLDQELGGLRPDALYVLAGRPGMGKSACALSIALHAARQGQNVLFVSLEMSASLLALRVLSMTTGIAAGRIERGALTDDEMARVQAARSDAASLPIAIWDEPTTSDDLADRVVEIQRNHGLGLLVVDYVSLLRDGGKNGETERVTRISNNLRNIARVGQLPVLALAQLNREADKRDNHKPVLSDLRDSGSLEQDAHAVLFVFRPQYYLLLQGESSHDEESDAEIIIAKNRQGRTGTTRAVFVPGRTLWLQPEPKPSPPLAVAAK
jgi:replicative DNA helicase